MRLRKIKEIAKRNIIALLILVTLYLIYIILINTFTGEQLQWLAVLFLFFLFSYRLENISNKLSGIKKEEYLNTYKIDYSVKANEIYSQDIFVKTLHVGGYTAKIEKVGGESYIVISDFVGDEICIIGLDNLGKLVTLLQERGFVEYYINEKDYISNAVREKENEINIYREYLESKDINDEATEDMQEDVIRLERNIIELKKKLQDIEEAIF